MTYLPENHLRRITSNREFGGENDPCVSILKIHKFIPYYLIPHSTYTAPVSHPSFSTEVLGGSIPCALRPGKFNLVSICARCGGRPKVSAISFPIGAVEEARKEAKQIAAELRS
jgi:hypothetical protein